MSPTGSSINSSAAELYLGFSSAIGSHGGFTVSILNPGSGFEYDTSLTGSTSAKARLSAAEQTNLQNAINTVITSPGGLAHNRPFVNLDENAIKPLAHTVFAAIGDRDSVGQKSSFVLAQNATLVCDAMKLNAFNAKTGAGSGVGKAP